MEETTNDAKIQSQVTKVNPGIMREWRESKSDSEDEESDSFGTEIEDSVHSKKDDGKNTSNSSEVDLSSENSEKLLAKRIKELGLDREFLIIECGCID